MRMRIVMKTDLNALVEALLLIQFPRKQPSLLSQLIQIKKQAEAYCFASA